MISICLVHICLLFLKIRYCVYTIHTVLYLDFVEKKLLGENNMHIENEKNINRVNNYKVYTCVTTTQIKKQNTASTPEPRVCLSFPIHSPPPCRGKHYLDFVVFISLFSSIVLPPLNASLNSKVQLCLFLNFMLMESYCIHSFVSCSFFSPILHF